MWIPSHITYETAFNQGYKGAWWIAHAMADLLAGKAVAAHAIDPSPLHATLENTKLVYAFLNQP